MELKKPNLYLALGSICVIMAAAIGIMQAVLLIHGNPPAMPGAAIAGGFMLASLPAGIFLLVRWFRYRKSHPRYSASSAALIVVAFFAIAGIGSLISIPNMLRLSDANLRTEHLNTELRGKVRDTYPEENVPMPENPRFAFYDRAKDTFVIPGAGYPAGTGDPEEVNVVLAYETRTVKIKSYINDSGWTVYYQPGYEPEVERTYVDVIRASDWSLITSIVFDGDLSTGQGHVNNLFAGPEQAD